MTESEWLGCTDPTNMLRFLRSKASDRQLRLFAVACCRHISHLLSDGRSRNALEVADRLADGMATEEERQSAQTAAREAMEALYPTHGDYAAQAVLNAVSRNSSDAIHADAVAFNAATAADDEDVRPNETKWITERTWQAGVCRDIFGNPFHPITIAPAILQWNDRTIPKLAEQIYQEPAFDCLPILADALEEAGCTDLEILNHCRGTGPHVRGCWVVDMVTGRS